MIRLVDRMINELSYSEIIRKQDSITKLFPTFHNRVKQVAKKGGVRLSKTQPGLWQFRIKSAGDNSHWYDAYVHWRDIESTIDKGVKDATLWTKDKSRVDMRKLATNILYNADMELVCSCPADLYWGGQYIRTQKGAKYTKPENRPPDTRNPRQYGAMCKHLQLLFDVLPFYASTMSKFLGDMYDVEIEKSSAEMLKTMGKFKQAADFLKKKEGEQKDDVKVAKKLRKKGIEPPPPKEEPAPEDEEKPDDEEPKEEEKEKRPEEEDEEDQEQRESVRRLCQCLI